MFHSVQIKEPLAINRRLIRHVPHCSPCHFHNIVKGVPGDTALDQTDHSL